MLGEIKIAYICVSGLSSYGRKQIVIKCFNSEKKVQNQSIYHILGKTIIL